MADLENDELNHQLCAVATDEMFESWSPETQEEILAGVWWSVVECGGVWWSVVECGGVWWSLLHLLFGVLRIFGTLIESNRKRSHDCSDCPYSKAGAARTVM